jgi:hypothetical protein
MELHSNITNYPHLHQSSRENKKTVRHNDLSMPGKKNTTTTTTTTNNYKNKNSLL